MTRTPEQLLIEAHLLRLLLELGEVRQPLRHHFEADGLRLCLHIDLDPDATGSHSLIDPSPRNQYERDILALLAEVGCPMTWLTIKERLEARRQIHGESTIRQGLGRLVNVGVLSNKRNRVGYRLTPAGQVVAAECGLDEKAAS